MKAEHDASGRRTKLPGILHDWRLTADDPALYGEGQKDALKALILDQAYAARALAELEAEWLALHEQLDPRPASRRPQVSSTPIVTGGDVTRS
jgi:hypothetical protein